MAVVVVGFNCDVIISCELAWRGVRHDATEVSGSGGVSAYGRGNSVGLTSILGRGQFLFARCILTRY